MITRIETKVVYRGELDNGVVITGPTFKGVYNDCLQELLDDYGYSLYFEVGRCDFSYGVYMTVYDNRFKYPNCFFESIRKVGELSVFSIDRKPQVIFRKADD